MRKQPKTRKPRQLRGGAKGGGRLPPEVLAMLMQQMQSAQPTGMGDLTYGRNPVGPDQLMQAIQ